VRSMWRLALVGVGFVVCSAVGLGGCVSEPASCAEAACDGTTEMCVFFGSDTLEPSTADCRPIVEGCEDDRSCECLDQSIEADSSLRFCFDAGGCTVNDGVIELVCPGG